MSLSAEERSRFGEGALFFWQVRKAASPSSSIVEGPSVRGLLLKRVVDFFMAGIE
jgi:hypothetical protein